MVSKDVRSDLENLVNEIAFLSDNISYVLDVAFNHDNVNDDLMKLSNDLVKNMVAFMFVLGEYQSELRSHKSKIIASQKQKAVKVNANYHNLRDNKGRFVKVQSVSP